MHRIHGKASLKRRAMKLGPVVDQNLFKGMPNIGQGVVGLNKIVRPVFGQASVFHACSCHRQCGGER